MLPVAQTSGGKFPVRTNADDGGARPGSLKTRNREALRFVSLALHSLPNGAEGTRRAFQRGISGNLSRRWLSLRLSCFPGGPTRKRHTYGAGLHQVQTSQDGLAEPYKYSKSVHRSSTIAFVIGPIRFLSQSASSRGLAFSPAGRGIWREVFETDPLPSLSIGTTRLNYHV